MSAVIYRMLLIIQGKISVIPNFAGETERAIGQIQMKEEQTLLSSPRCLSISLKCNTSQTRLGFWAAASWARSPV